MNNPTHNELYEKFEFKNIAPEQAEEAADIEVICFPPNEACKRDTMIERANKAADAFIVATDKQTGKMAGFLTAIATDEHDFRDEFFTDITLHDKNGSDLMILSLCVRPEYRGLGLSRELMNEFCCRETEKGKKRVVLTCVDEKVGMYRKFGFRDLGNSGSVWGGHNWHEMDKTL